MVAPRKTRAVSTREAQRHLSRLLDEIDREESAVLIVRYGRPAAMLMPFEETSQAWTLPRISETALWSDETDEAEVFDDVDLDADQAYVLTDMAQCTDVNWHLDRLYRDRSRANQLLVAVSRLELDGLVEREWHGGFTMTRKGRRLAQKLDSGV